MLQTQSRTTPSQSASQNTRSIDCRVIERCTCPWLACAHDKFAGKMKSKSKCNKKSNSNFLLLLTKSPVFWGLVTYTVSSHIAIVHTPLSMSLKYLSLKNSIYLILSLSLANSQYIYRTLYNNGSRLWSSSIQEEAVDNWSIRRRVSWFDNTNKYAGFHSKLNEMFVCLSVIVKCMLNYLPVSLHDSLLYC